MRADGAITESPGATQSRASCSALRGTTPHVRCTLPAGSISSVNETRWFGRIDSWSTPMMYG